MIRERHQGQLDAMHLCGSLYFDGHAIVLDAQNKRSINFSDRFPDIEICQQDWIKVISKAVDRPNTAVQFDCASSKLACTICLVYSGAKYDNHNLVTYTIVEYPRCPNSDMLEEFRKTEARFKTLIENAPFCKFQPPVITNRRV